MSRFVRHARVLESAAIIVRDEFAREVRALAEASVIGLVFFVAPVLALCAWADWLSFSARTASISVGLLLCATTASRIAAFVFGVGGDSLVERASLIVRMEDENINQRERHVARELAAKRALLGLLGSETVPGDDMIAAAFSMPGDVAVKKSLLSRFRANERVLSAASMDPSRGNPIQRMVTVTKTRQVEQSGGYYEPVYPGLGYSSPMHWVSPDTYEESFEEDELLWEDSFPVREEVEKLRATSTLNRAEG